jgi:hypothetical protein
MRHTRYGGNPARNLRYRDGDTAPAKSKQKAPEARFEGFFFQHSNAKQARYCHDPASQRDRFWH